MSTCCGCSCRPVVAVSGTSGCPCRCSAGRCAPSSLRVSMPRQRDLQSTGVCGRCARRCSGSARHHASWIAWRDARPPCQAPPTPPTTTAVPTSAHCQPDDGSINRKPIICSRRAGRSVQMDPRLRRIDEAAQKPGARGRRRGRAGGRMTSGQRQAAADSVPPDGGLRPAPGCGRPAVRVERVGRSPGWLAWEGGAEGARDRSDCACADQRDHDAAA